MDAKGTLRLALAAAVIVALQFVWSLTPVEAQDTVISMVEVRGVRNGEGGLDARLKHLGKLLSKFRDYRLEFVSSNRATAPRGGELSWPLSKGLELVVGVEGHERSPEGTRISLRVSILDGSKKPPRSILRTSVSLLSNTWTLFVLEQDTSGRELIIVAVSARAGE